MDSGAMDLGLLYSDAMSDYILPFTRISAMLMVLPLIGARLVSMRIRLVLSVLITVAVAPQVTTPTGIEPGTLGWSVIVAKELLIGVMHGLIVQMLFQTLVIGGQTIAMQSGLGFAQLVDPVNGISVAAISQLYLLMANIFFFSTNGHLAVFQVLVDSFSLLPIGMHQWDAVMSDTFLGVISWMFASGLLIALPIVIALLMVNFTFGVISKLSPQFNVFSFGFAFIVAVGIMIIAMTLPRIYPSFHKLTGESLLMMRSMYGG